MAHMRARESARKNWWGLGLQKMCAGARFAGNVVGGFVRKRGHRRGEAWSARGRPGARLALERGDSRLDGGVGRGPNAYGMLGLFMRE